MSTKTLQYKLAANLTKVIVSLSSFPFSRKDLKQATYRDLKYGDKEYKAAREQFFRIFSDWMKKPSECDRFF